MLSVSYSEAAVEVLDILRHMSVSDFNKVPINFIEFLEENASESYSPELDYSKPLFEMDLKEETKAIIGMIYQKYWCPENKKEKFNQIIRENEEKFQEEINDKYNKDKLFEKDTEEEQVLEEIEEENKTQLVVKTNIFKSIINKIKSLFSK